MNLYDNLVLWTLISVNLTSVDGNHFHWWKCSSQCQKCIRRATPLEQWISEYYSGLFSRDPPPIQVQFSVNPSSPTNPVNTNITNTGSPESASGGIIYPDNYAKPGSEHQNYSNVGVGGCCDTFRGFFAPEHANVSGKIYKVVHLQNGTQFIPIGRCRNGTTCPHGTCEEIRRYHWTLVYNDLKNATAPVTFIKFGVPSHCECVNIGRARP